MVYRYADPYSCNCLYVGDQQAYEQYERLARAKYERLGRSKQITDKHLEAEETERQCGGVLLGLWGTLGELTLDQTVRVHGPPGYEPHGEGIGGCGSISDHECVLSSSSMSLLLLVLAAGMLAVSRPAHARSWTFVGLTGRDETGLSALLARQQDPSSAEYRRWLTPREFGERFGASRVDVRRASRWLRDAGCRVRRFPSRRLLACAGPTQLEVPESQRGLVSDTFGTTEAPDVVFNLVGPLPQPNAVLQGRSFFTPQDFARVYGLGPAIAPSVDGAGQTIGLVALSALDPADVVAFREGFGLPPLDLDQDGGIRQPGTTAEAEAVLDVTWSGAVAPGARVVLAVGSAVTDSLATLVNRADVDIISSSITL